MYNYIRPFVFILFNLTLCSPPLCSVRFFNPFSFSLFFLFLGGGGVGGSVNLRCALLLILVDCFGNILYLLEVEASKC